MADVAKTVAIIFEGQDKTSAALASVESGIKGVGTEAGAATSQVDKLDNEIDQLSGRRRIIEDLSAAFTALAGAVVAKAFIDANVAHEQFIKTMTMARGSASEAAKEYEYVREVSNRLGLDIVSTAEAYAKFSSATRGSAIDGANARVIFEAFAGTMSATGSSAADVAGAMTQLSQGVSKGKFELEDLKSIAERIPGFFGNFATSLGVSTSALYDMISAGQIGSAEMLKFAQAMEKGLSPAQFEGYINSMNRLRNSTNDAFLAIGQTGVFDALTKGIQIATAAITGAIAGLQLLGEINGAVYGAIATGNWSNLGDAIDAAMAKAADKTRGVRDAMLGVQDATDKTTVSVDNVSDALTRRLSKGTSATYDLKKATEDADKALKELGIDPKQFEKPIESIIKAFTDLANNPMFKDGKGGSQILSGLLVTLDAIAGGPQGAGAIKQVSDAIESAYKRNALSASEYAAATNALQVKQSGLWDGMINTTGSLQEQKKAHEEAAKAAEKQKDQAFTLRLELEKLYSNERIKTIEAKVKLDVAEFEYKAKIVEAAFDSIDASIESTGKLIGDLWKQMNDPTLSFSDKWALEDQIEKENERRDAAFKLQKLLTEATIKEIEARTKAFQSGDALIKIDGAGLQPHLEAFMWEILRTIQTRVNADGLKLLLNT